MKSWRCSGYVEVVNGRIPVIAGTGSNNTADSIALSIAAEKLGVDGLLLVTPYYNKPTQRGLYAHYKAIADSVKIPIILYNVPSRTSVDLLPETVIELAKIPNIMALKEASGKPERCRQILDAVKPEFKVYSGNDGRSTTLWPTAATGHLRNVQVAPKATREIVADYLMGDTEKAKASQQYYNKLIDALFMETNPVPSKKP